VSTHPSLLAGMYLMVPKICGVTPTIKMHHADASLDRGIKTV